MAVTDAYATAATYRSVIDKSDTGEDSEVLDDLTAVSRFIEKKLGRFFTKDATDTTRIYVPRSRSGPTRPDWAESENPWKYGGASRLLEVDDLVSVTSIEVDENRTGSYTLTLEATDYELLPRNAATGPEPGPYRQIELTQWGNRWAWTPGNRVKVTGVWGWPSVPAAIARACIHLTAILRLESARATARVNELDQVLTTSQQAQYIVSDLMRHYGKVTL